MFKKGWHKIAVVIGSALAILGITYKMNTSKAPQTQTTNNIDTKVFVTDSTVHYGLNGNIAFSPLDYSSDLLCDKVAELGVAEVRWPGGTISAKYHWTPEDILNLKNLTKRGIDIIFVLNVISSNLQEQLAMLRFADSIGVPVKYVEFGNELTNGQNEGRIVFHRSGIEYGNLCAEWADSIRKSLSNVKFGCWLENKPDIKTWVSETLSRFTSDGAVNHFYPNAANVAPNGIVDTALLHEWCLKALDHAGVSNINIPIWATELNFSDSDLPALKPGEHEKALLYMLNLFTQLGFAHIIVHNIDGNNGVFTMTKTSVQFTEMGKAYKNYLHSLK